MKGMEKSYGNPGHIRALMAGKICRTQETQGLQTIQETYEVTLMQSAQEYRRYRLVRLFLSALLLSLLLSGIRNYAFAEDTESGHGYSPWRSSESVKGSKTKVKKTAPSYTLSSLNKQGKKCYKALLKKNRKSKKKVKVSLSKKISMTVSKSTFKSGSFWNSSKILSLDDSVCIASTAVLDDNPELYWINCYSWSYYYYYRINKKSVSIKIVSVTFKPVPFYSRAKNEFSAVKKTAKQVAANIKSTRPDQSRYTTARMIYEYLCGTASYGFIGGMEYSPASILLDKYAHTGVCNGYALAFKMICTECKIPCRYVGSEFYEHAWNIVQSDDGLWYGVDATWGDNVGSVDYRWFMFGQDEVDSGEHPGRAIRQRGDFTFEFALPALAPTGLLYAA